MERAQVSVIISTYNQPEWLRKVLWSYEIQTYKDFEIVLADDGSNHKTKKVVNDFKEGSALRIKYVWQEDLGFRKTKILNQAILKASSDYLIFTDGDCIARNDFVETHWSKRSAGVALSGGYYKLNEEVSKSIQKEHIFSQECFNFNWLSNQGQKRDFKANKLSRSKLKTEFLNTVTPTKATFDGMNVSCFKKDILAVNGFDERMQYGGEDREVGERMMNNGIRFKQIRYSAICLHLWHDRPYADNDNDVNLNIRKDTKSQNKIWTDYGISS